MNRAHAATYTLLSLAFIGGGLGSLPGCGVAGLPQTESNSPGDESSTTDNDLAFSAGATYIEAATLQDAEVAIHVSTDGAEARLAGEPTHGRVTFGELDSEYVELIYAPAPGFVGEDSISVELVGSAPLPKVDVLIRVYPSVVFMIESEYDGDPLTIRAIAYTIDGSPLPPGTYTWAFEDEHDGGPMATHAIRTHTFSNSGLYHIALALTLVGAAAPINCAHAQTGRSAAEITLELRVRGNLRDSAGGPLSGVVVSANNGGSTSITDAEGTYVIRVPYAWSGTITPDLGAYEFSPRHRDYVDLRGNMRQEDYTGTPHGTPTFELPNQHEFTNEDTSKVLTLQAGSGTEDLTFLIVDPSQHGRLTNLDNSPPAFATVQYMPDSNFNGSDRFTFKAVGADGRESTVAEFALTVNAVNDAPAFTEPPDQAVVVGEAKVIAIKNVVAGPSDEAGQTLVFTAQSSNQAVLPNANIQFTGSPPTVQMSITASGTGATTLTITAQDNGGTQNGGADTRQAVVQINAFVGSTIAGAITFVDTVGHQPPLGVVSLSFNGSGSWEGADFVCQTSHTGAYFQIVPEGWTGTVAATDANYLLLTPSAHVYNAPVTEPQLDQNFAAWKPPIGIPTPEFGIKETHWMYAAQRFDFDGDGVLEEGEEYPDAGNGPYTRFIDNTHPNATDDDNPRGTANTPRLTIPRPLLLDPGEVVEIRGGPYTQTQDSLNVKASGTSSSPIFIRGGTASLRPSFDKRLLVVDTSFLILENLELDGANNPVQGLLIAESSYVALRHSTSTNHNKHGLAVNTFADNILIFNNEISYNGDYLADYDQDYHGITVGKDVTYLWAIDNYIHHNGGNGIQINPGNASTWDATHHVFVGRNTSHTDRQGLGAVKFSRDVVFSQNHVFDTRPVIPGNPTGHALASAYNGDNIWFLCNIIHDCETGIRVSPAQGPGGAGGGLNHYMIGNLIYDIHHSDTDRLGNPLDYSSTDAYSNGKGITIWGNISTNHIVGNTVHNAETSIASVGHEPLHILNNILADRADPNGFDVQFLHSEAAAASTLDFSLINGSTAFKWGSGPPYSLVELQANTGQAANCLNAEPNFVGQGDTPFAPDSTSPAIGAGCVSDVLATFEELYGLDIAKDLRAIQRPYGGDWEIGAYEYMP